MIELEKQQNSNTKGKRELELENEILRNLLVMAKKQPPALIISEALTNNKNLPKTCGECRFWAGYSCILKPTLRCKRDKLSRGCPLCTLS